MLLRMMVTEAMLLSRRTFARDVPAIGRRSSRRGAGNASCHRCMATTNVATLAELEIRYININARFFVVILLGYFLTQESAAKAPDFSASKLQRQESAPAASLALP